MTKPSQSQTAGNAPANSERTGDWVIAVSTRIEFDCDEPENIEGSSEDGQWEVIPEELQSTVTKLMSGNNCPYRFDFGDYVIEITWRRRVKSDFQKGRERIDDFYANIEKYTKEFAFAASMYYRCKDIHDDPKVVAAWGKRINGNVATVSNGDIK